MAEVQNCPTCNGIFNYTGVRDICPMCAREEDKMYEKVYRFLRRGGNRSSTVEKIVLETGVTTTLLYKWVRKGHLQPVQFPNLGYPCDSCGELIAKGKLCKSCTNNLRDELEAFEASQETIIAMNDTYKAHGKKTT